MKKVIFLTSLLITTVSFAQRIIDREVGEFNEIKVYDLIEVNLIKSNENRILIKGEHVDDIKFVNKDGVLKLRMQLERKFQGEDTLIEVYYTDIDIIDGNEGAKIVCNETVEKDKITLKAQEGAQITVGLEVNHVDVRAVTGGIVEASGLATNQFIVITTGGIFEGRELKTSNSSVKIRAGGEASLSATEDVDINVTAGGDVYVYGNPKNVNKNTVAGGRIYIRD
ncbi:head GIN domain-containing protein [Muriicola soli]|uniref:DUF2807 domain-containing protein n=1 Tax=Muriicola soli TaxID=2507538 RepID=A0A411E7A7_9FLAO|nr:head GIN domain-containing protein [Muriicola soli]QBA63403.1 DUF2807 domain-containing protein [Muriicola soli]